MARREGVRNNTDPLTGFPVEDPAGVDDSWESLWDPERELTSEEIRRLVGRKGYPLTQLYISERQRVQAILEARGFEPQPLPFKAVIDQMLDFCRKRCPDLLDEVRRLLDLKHLVMECWTPLFERFLPREEEDLAEVARERARIALWQALDHLNRVNPDYVARWIRQGVSRGLGRRKNGAGAAENGAKSDSESLPEGFPGEGEARADGSGGNASAEDAPWGEGARGLVFVPLTEGRGGERPEDGSFNLNTLTGERIDEAAARELLSEEAFRCVAGEPSQARDIDHERLRRGIEILKERLRQMGSADIAEQIDRFLEEAARTDGVPGLFRRFTRDAIARIRALAYSIPELVEFI